MTREFLRLFILRIGLIFIVLLMADAILRLVAHFW